MRHASRDIASSSIASWTVGCGRMSTVRMSAIPEGETSMMSLLMNLALVVVAVVGVVALALGLALARAAVLPTPRPRA